MNDIVHLVIDFLVLFLFGIYVFVTKRDLRILRASLKTSNDCAESLRKKVYNAVLLIHHLRQEGAKLTETLDKIRGFTVRK